MKQRVRTVSYIDRRGSVEPYIRHQGKWLEEKGFRIGDRIEISIPTPGRIVIEKQERREES